VRVFSDPDTKDRVVAVVIVVVVAVAVGVSAQGVGFTRDEGYYFKAAELYAGWFRELVTSPRTALSSASIDAHLSYNPEHPFGMKGLFALSRALQVALGLDVMGHQAMRLPAWIVAGVATALVWLLARTVRLSRSASLLAALAFVSAPHVWWHMQVACFDIAATAAHTGLVVAWLRLRHTRRGALWIGVIFGICAAAKHNVLPVPALFVLHWLLGEMPRPSLRGVSIPAGFVSLAVVGPIVYVLLWPYLWPDVVGRFGAYVAFHLRHEHYPILLFGELLSAPPFPWSFPVVMWGLTLPLPILVLIVGGLFLGIATAWRHLRQRLAGCVTGGGSVVPLGDVVRSTTGSTSLLLLLNGLYPVLLIALPSTPIFGGTKHWMNGLPFLIVLGAFALEEALTRLGARRRFVLLAVGVVVAMPGFFSTARVWPNGLSAYNELAGFSRGAANLGLQRTFWGYEIRPTLPLINERAPPSARLHGGDVNVDSHRRYVEDGLVRKDIAAWPTVRGADVAHVEPQGEFRQQQLDVWNEWGRRAPAAIVDKEGVPLSTVTLRR
jgi:hypothetical protein